MDWIGKAFSEANKQVEHAKKVNERIEFFMDRDSKGVLENWGDMVGEKNATKVANIMMDEDNSELFYSLCRAFAVMGYYWRLTDERNGVKL